MADLKQNEVKMRDGRIVAIKEISGADEMIVASQLGKLFEPNGGGAFVFQTCLIARSVESVDGVPVKPMKGYEDYREFMGQFRGSDSAKIKAKYQEINGEGDEEAGKPSEQG